MVKYLKKEYVFIHFEKSEKPLKKYKAILQNKKTGKNVSIHFGGIRDNGKPYEQWKDSTGLGLYTKYNHRDKERRKRYQNRHNKEKPSFKKYWSAGYFSWKYLW